MNLHKPLTDAIGLLEKTELLTVEKYKKSFHQQKNSSHSVASSSFSSSQTDE